MPIENINFAGINRAITDYATTGACEELINLRPTTGGLVPVKPFNAIMSNASHEKVYIHHTSDGTDNYIVVDISSTSVTAYLYGSNPRVTFFDITGLASTAVVESVLNSVHFAYTGNIVLFSICDQDNGVYENHSYIWKDGSYSEMEANVPNINFAVSDSLEYGYSDFSGWEAISSNKDAAEFYSNKLNEIQEKNPELCTGPVIIAVAFKTKDGNTMWTGNWRVYDPIKKANSSGSYFDTNTTFVSTTFNKTKFITDYGHGYLMYDLADSTFQMRYAAAKVDLVFSAINQGQTPDWVEASSVLQSIEIYASRPVIYVDYSYEYSKYATEGTDPKFYPFFPLPQLDYEEMDLAGQLLYHQASIQLASLAEGQQTVTLNFGGNVQLVNETLDADAGAVTRFGHLIAYNARFHYYDSVTNIKVGMPYFQINATTGSYATAKFYVRYSDEDESKLLYVGSSATNAFLYTSPADIVIAPSINVKSVISCAYDSTWSIWHVREYQMTESSTYNYSIFAGGVYTDYEYSLTLPTEYGDADTYAQTAGVGAFTNKEPNAINVTEQYSPFVFLVEHSYQAPGHVLDIQPQMSYTADISYGEYPLNVFTQRGLYALLQGSANVLYGAFKPLSNLVAKGGVPVEMGTFFLSAGSLWLVSGVNVTLISDALSLGPHKFIRDCTGYKKISGGTNEASPQYDVSDYVSAVPFDDFSRNAVLAYNRFRDELFVSNPGYAYTYVLSLKYRQWFKISGILWQDEAGSTIANLKYGVNGLKDIVDLSTEKDTAWVTPSPGAAPVYTPIPTVHLQTRPFSIAYQYTHIHRVVSMIRAALSSTCQVVVALYGSDNLQEWALLSYASRKGRVVNLQEEFLKFSQIRTASASRSWRYYTICIGGKVPTDTDFGPVLFDYQPVERRFG